jgi:dolichol-phosphate mannosyltransferase
MKSVTVALLAYKEEDNLKVLLPKIHEQIEKVTTDYEILVVDTEKPLDHTEEVCRKFGARYVNQEEDGFGGAFRTAIRYADKELFLILDSDGSHDPSRIPVMYRYYLEGGYDLVIGSRYVRGGKTSDNLTSIMMSKILNGVYRTILGIKAHDISTDYRLYNTAQLKSIKLTHEYYDILQEVLVKLSMNKRDFKIGEIPINFTKRMFGESKRQLIPFIISYIKTLFELTALKYRIKKER